MSVYAIGDIQGCFEALQCLLTKIRFNPDKDQLWLVGDLVNRGPDSLATLRYLYSIRDSVKIVLGNHDLHLVAAHYQLRKPGKSDTLDQVLSAPDCQQLIDWLLTWPLVYHQAELGFTLVHAGIPPQWSLENALAYSAEVQQVLNSDQRMEFLAAMYGNEPSVWSDDLKGMDRLRLITNYCTRMRFCNSAGQLELLTKESADAAPPGFAPWFSSGNRRMRNQPIIFGHWAALQGKVDLPNLYALDTGCIWGGALTALDLACLTKTQCDCH